MKNILILIFLIILQFYYGQQNDKIDDILKNIRQQSLEYQKEYPISYKIQNPNEQFSEINTQQCQIFDRHQIDNFHEFSYQEFDFITDYQKIINNLEYFGKFQQNQNIKTTLIFTVKTNFHQYVLMNEQSICLFQVYNHIPGLEFSRDKISKFYRQYYLQNYKCLTMQNIDLFGVYYRLNDKNECIRYFNLTKSQQYKKSKNSSNQWKLTYTTGFLDEKPKFLTNILEDALIIQYDFGHKCSWDNYQPLIIQSYRTKLSQVIVRAYVIFSSLNPFLCYVHRRIDIYECLDEQNNAVCISPKKSDKQILEKFNINYEQLENIVFKNTAVIFQIIKEMSQNIQDSRFYEFLSIDYAINADKTLDFIRMNRFNQIINDQDYDQILKDGQEIIFLQHQQRLKNLINNIIQNKYSFNEIIQNNVNKKVDTEQSNQFTLLVDSDQKY